MNFYPQDKFPKKGTPVYNGNGEQYDLSDPRYAYQDGLQNTQKNKDSSTDNLYSTIDSALARAQQIGCEGYHQVTENGNSVCIHIEGFNPYFFFKIPQEWGNKEFDEFKNNTTLQYR